jgi:hypothetical protein
MKINCLKCKTETNHSVTSEYKESNQYPFDPIEIDNETHTPPPIIENKSYQIIKCDGCGDISFREYVEIPNMLIHKKGKYRFNDTMCEETIYPRRKINYKDFKRYQNIPVKLERIYRESIDAYNNDYNLLCAIGLRAIIEGVCKDKQALKRVLPDKIEELLAKNIISNNLAEALKTQKVLGDSAVHQLDIPTENELIQSIKLIEHLLNDVYEMDVIMKVLREADAFKNKAKYN